MFFLSGEMTDHPMESCSGFSSVNFCSTNTVQAGVLNSPSGPVLSVSTLLCIGEAAEELGGQKERRREHLHQLLFPHLGLATAPVMSVLCGQVPVGWAPGPCSTHTPFVRPPTDIKGCMEGSTCCSALVWFDHSLCASFQWARYSSASREAPGRASLPP